MPVRQPFRACFGALISFLSFHYAYSIGRGAVRGDPSPLIYKSGSADFPIYTSEAQGRFVAALWCVFGVLTLLAAVDLLRKKPRRSLY